MKKKSMSKGAPFQKKGAASKGKSLSHAQKRTSKGMKSVKGARSNSHKKGKK